ncbi:MAG: hypothetical protein RLZ94_1424 [Actinomycetota bacterium]
MTPYAALLERARRDPASPLLTYRDLATGERMELSAASLANAIAKTAGMLRDELDADPGSVIAMHLPFHWQRVVWLGACAATSTVFAPGAAPGECDVLVVDRARLGLAGTAREDVLVSLAPFGLPERADVPPGVTDAAVAMRGHPDAFVPWEPTADTTPLLRGPDRSLSHGDVMDAASAELAARGIGVGERFALVEPDPQSDLLALAGPLARGGAAILLARSDSGDVAATLREEGVTTEA